MRKEISILRRVPNGFVTTYAEIARAAKTHPRAVGQLMKRNTSPVTYPCYKVVLMTGAVGNYSAPGGRKRKIQLLEKEGIIVKKGRVDLNKYMFKLSGNLRKKPHKG